MSHHPSVIEAAIQATKTYGAGSGGTRNISGTAHLHVELERTIANLHEKEAGLVFTSGYVANEAALCTLAKGLPNCVAFCDEKIHASMIQGINHSRVPKHVFSHNNLDQLRQQLSKYDKKQPKLIAFVSVYSMEGDFAPIEVICDLAKEYKEKALSLHDYSKIIALSLDYIVEGSCDEDDEDDDDYCFDDDDEDLEEMWPEDED